MAQPVDRRRLPPGWFLQPPARRGPGIGVTAPAPPGLGVLAPGMRPMPMQVPAGPGVGQLVQQQRGGNPFERVQVGAPLARPNSIRPDSFLRGRDRGNFIPNSISTLTAPAGPDEPGFVAAGRNLLGAMATPFQWANSGANAVGGAISDFVTTPNQRAAREAKNFWTQYGVSSDMNAHRKRGSAGVDLKMPAGTPLPAPVGGTVRISRGGRGGNTVTIMGDDGRQYGFSHLSGVNVKDGQRVTPGMIFGASGGVPGTPGAGNSSGAHVHTQVKDAKGNHLDPLGILSRVQDAAASFGAPPPGFDLAAQGFQQAGAFTDQAMTAAMTPFETTVQQAPMPTAPESKDFVGPDFTKGDEAFAAAAPKDPFAEEGSKEKMLRQNWMRGMAEALLTINNGRPVGMGEVLLKMGAGAMSGRAVGEDKILAKQERYDALMQQYNQALATREDGKAQQIAQTLNANIKQENDEAWKNYGVALQQWTTDNAVDIQGGYLIRRSRDKDGNLKISSTPIKSQIEPSFLMHKASQALAFGSASQQHAQWQYGAQQALAGQGLSYLLSQGATTPQSQEQAVFDGVGARIWPAVESGAIWNMVPRQILDPIINAASEIHPTTDQLGQIDEATRERRNAYIAQELIKFTITSPEMQRILFQGPTAPAATAVQRARNTSRTTRTDARGRTTTSETTRAY